VEDNWECVFGKHSFKKTHDDTDKFFLDAEIFFKCEKCGVNFRIDQVVLKLHVMGRSKEANLIAHGR